MIITEIRKMRMPGNCVDWPLILIASLQMQSVRQA